MERAKAGAVVVRQHAARVGAGNHGDARIRQFFHCLSATQRPAAQPQQRLFRLFELRPQRVNHSGIHGRSRYRFDRSGYQRQRNFGALNINRDFHRDRSAWRGLRVLDGFMQNRYRLIRIADAVRPF